MPQLVSDCATSNSSGEFNYGAFKFRLTMFGVRSLIVLSVFFGIAAATAANDLSFQALVWPWDSLLMIAAGVLCVCYDTVYGTIITAPVIRQCLPGNPVVRGIASAAYAFVYMSTIFTLLAAACAVWRNFSSTTSSNSVVLALYFQYYSGYVALFQLSLLAFIFGVICAARGSESFPAEVPLISETSIAYFFYGIILLWPSKILVCIVRLATCILVCIVRLATCILVCIVRLATYILVCIVRLATYILVCIVRTVTYILTLFFRVGAILTPPFFDQCSLVITAVLWSLSWPVLLILWYQTGSVLCMVECIQALSECGDKYRVILCIFLSFAWVIMGGLNLSHCLILTIMAVLSTESMRDVVTKLCLGAKKEIPSVGAQIVNEINGWSARLDGSST